MNTKILAIGFFCGMALTVSEAATLCERWGPAGMECTYPNTLQTADGGKKGKGGVMQLNLAALPKDARVFRATLRNKRVGQPKDPIEIRVISKLNAQGEPEYEGKPLPLEPPRFASYDLTEIVKTWQADPKKNLGLALVSAEGFDTRQAYVDICYEGTSKNLPSQVSRLKAVHHDGQTFLTWKEMDMMQPAADKSFWVGNFSKGKVEALNEPGKGFMDVPRLNCIRQGELRRLQMYDVIPPPGGSQDSPKYIRKKGWPDACYRVYRSKKKITAETIGEAEFAGEADLLCGYDLTMVGIGSSGEYYNKHELPETAIPTYCLEDGKCIPLGEAFYVYTAQDDGPCYYAVTLVKDGTENLSEISAENSLQAPIDEKKAPFKPVLQFVTDMQNNLWYKYYCWPAPPASNLPWQRASGVTLSVPKALKQPCGLLIRRRDRGNDWLILTVRGRAGYAGELASNEGVGTLRAVSESKVDYFDERYLLYTIQGIIAKWNVDRNRVEFGGANAFSIRHPELFKVMYAGTTDSFEINFDPKWNPGVSALFGAFGAPDVAMTVDGQKAWDIVGIGWYLRNHPTNDIPFYFAFHGGKESGHAIEFGWQDDPAGWAALRDGRVPYAGSWGGGPISKEVYAVVDAMPIDKTLPAFSRCSLDNNPGNGDPADGDPWGQLNGFMIWDFANSVDKDGQWEMTVGLASDAPQDHCTVDITPRRCSAFKAKAGAKFKWTNTSLADNKPVQKGEVAADQWGLVTIKKAVVTKGKNRIVIEK